MDFDEHYIDQPLSLTNKLFLEDSFGQASPPTILEEDATYQYNSLDNTQPINTQFSNIPNITEPLSITTTDESIPQINGNKCLNC